MITLFKKYGSRTLCLLLSLWLCALMCLSVSAEPQESSSLSLSAKSAILIDAHSGEVLYAKNAYERMGMASTTKIMTALVARKLMSEERTVRIPKEATGIEGSSVYLVEGELLSVKDLLYALLLASANDAATALAIAASGSVEAFADEMNGYAERMGLKDTHFTNPHGLYDDSHYTSAYDLALISAEALKDPLIAKIAATKKATIPHGVFEEGGESTQALRYLVNHNKMLSLYDGAIGVKTGFTKKTGRCLVSAAERDGLCLVAVTLNATDDWNDHQKLLDYGYSMYERHVFFDVGEFSYAYPITGGCEEYVMAVNTEPLALTLPRESFEPTTSVYSAQRFEFAPVHRGRSLGTVTLRVGEREVSSPLEAAYSVEAVNTKKKFLFFTY